MILEVPRTTKTLDLEVPRTTKTSQNFDTSKCVYIYIYVCVCVCVNSENLVSGAWWLSISRLCSH